MSVANLLVNYDFVMHFQVHFHSNEYYKCDLRIRRFCNKEEDKQALSVCNCKKEQSSQNNRMMGQNMTVMNKMGNKKNSSTRKNNHQPQRLRQVQ